MYLVNRVLCRLSHRPRRTLSSTLPVASLATATAVAMCFSPEEDFTAFAVDAIDRAETSRSSSVLPA